MEVNEDKLPLSRLSDLSVMVILLISPRMVHLLHSQFTINWLMVGRSVSGRSVSGDTPRTPSRLSLLSYRRIALSRLAPVSRHSTSRRIRQIIFFLFSFLTLALSSSPSTPSIKPPAPSNYGEGIQNYRVHSEGL